MLLMRWTMLFITVGRFQSMLGFEAFEPTGLYQFSFAYDNSILPAYGEGVKYNYASVSLRCCSLSDYESYDAGRLAVQTLVTQLSLRLPIRKNAIYFRVPNKILKERLNDRCINAYVTYATGAWIFAGELNIGNSETGSHALPGDDVDAMSGLLMANYAYSDVASVTGRISFESFEANDAVDTELNQTKLTLAHGYAFTDNLFLVTEVSVVDATLEATGSADQDFESLQGAVELIFAF